MEKDQKKETTKKPAAKEKQQKGGDDKKGENLLAITVTKEENFSEWYTQVIQKAELLEYYDVSGCYVLRPWAFAIWERIQEFFDAAIKKSGVQNAYFPLLVSKSALMKEKDHIAGFAPEVAWVTKSGDSDLAEPVAIRPTSETIMYPCYAKWIRSHRDLPLRLNQWCSVVRWEFKHPVPFLRTREFLWQEGHSAFATLPEAEKEVLEILNLYGQVFEDLLAVPVVKGRKSEGEKFAGGYYTTTCEAFIPASGRGIQAATSHCLGQNFSKMFDITFEDDNKTKQFAWQNSWGLTTRSIGVMIMVHGDNKGLVLPPRVAPVQVIVVPIPPPKGKGDYAAILARALELVEQLKAVGVRAQADTREGPSPFNKYYHWEQKGVPLRVEYGMKDHDAQQCVVALRYSGEKRTVKLDGFAASVQALLQEVQKGMLERSRKENEGRISHITKWDEFIPSLDKGNRVLAPWCEQNECEDLVKKKSGEHRAANDKGEALGFRLTGAAKTLCLPFEQPALAADAVCFHCGKPAKKWCLFGRSY